MRFKAYEIIERAVDEGIGWGLNRAYKYSETPTREQLEQHLLHNITNTLCEVVDFEQGGCMCAK